MNKLVKQLNITGDYENSIISNMVHGIATDERICELWDSERKNSIEESIALLGANIVRSQVMEIAMLRCDKELLDYMDIVNTDSRR